MPRYLHNVNCQIGASVSEPPLVIVDSTDALSRYIYIHVHVYIDIIIDVRPSYVHRYCACAALRANVAGRIGNGFSPAESSFLCPNPMMMMIWPGLQTRGRRVFPASAR